MKQAIQMPIRAGAKRDINDEQAKETAALIERGADKNEPSTARKVGRPPSKNAFDSTLPSITCSSRTTEMVELLAKELDRSVAWVIRDLVTKGAERKIMSEELEHKLKL